MTPKNEMVSYFKAATDSRKEVKVEYPLIDLLKYIRAKLQIALEKAGMKGMEVPPQNESWKALSDTEKTERIKEYHDSVKLPKKGRMPLLQVLKKYIPLSSTVDGNALETALVAIVADCQALKTDKIAALAIIKAIIATRADDKASNVGR